MAQTSWPFENIDTTETQFSQLFRNLGAGVQGTPSGTELQVSAGTGLAVNVGAGQAMVRGHYYLSNAIEALSLTTADGTNPRIDTVILRLNPTLNSIVLAVLTGTPNASPVAPTLTQTDSAVFELPLANVLVPASAGVPSTITDRRIFLGSRFGLWTTAGRPSAPVIGSVGFNTTLESPEYYDGSAWIRILDSSAIPSGGSAGQILSKIDGADYNTQWTTTDGIRTFANAAARDSAIPSPTEGMYAHLNDTDTLTYYTGSAWTNRIPTVTPAKILQVVSTCKTDTYSLNAGGFNNITGLAATITPTSATSKVMVFLTIGTVDASAGSLMQGDVTRDGTAIGIGNADASRNRVGWFIGTKAADEPQSPAWSFLDSPATTSAVTYQARLFRSGGTAYINRYSTDSNTGNVGRSVSTITLMEVTA